MQSVDTVVKVFLASWVWRHERLQFMDYNRCSKATCQSGFPAGQFLLILGCWVSQGELGLAGRHCLVHGRCRLL